MSQPPSGPPPSGPPSSGPPPSGQAPSAAWQPPPAYAAPAGSKTSGLAIASLVTGILFCFAVTPIVAVVLGHLALDQIRDSEGTITGRGLAIAGVTLGWIFLGLTALGLLAWVISLLAV
ncbi:MAG TPA: DUF4190 domain-containing protein [Acidimicrobiia bacterium]